MTDMPFLCCMIAGLTPPNCQCKLPSHCYAQTECTARACVVQALKLLTPLVRKLGPNANPGTLKKLPKRAIAVWTFYAGAVDVAMVAEPICVVCVLVTDKWVSCY